MNIELSEVAKSIMNYLWDYEEGLSFRQIYDHFTVEVQKTWKRQTLFTHLTILIDRGFIRTEGYRRKMIYIPAISRETYQGQFAYDILKKAYDGSLSKFVSTYMSCTQIGSEEADEIIALLERQKE